jgi:hypothetical protein
VAFQLSCVRRQVRACWIGACYRRHDAWPHARQSAVNRAGGGIDETSAERTVIYLTGVTAEVADAPRLVLIVMFWGLVSLKNDPVYCPLPPVNSAPLQF